MEVSYVTGVPQIIQVMDKHDLVLLKPMVTTGNPPRNCQIDFTSEILKDTHLFGFASNTCH